MLLQKWIAGIALAAASTLLPVAALNAKPQQVRPPVSADENFLALRDAVRNGDADKAMGLAAQLKNYPVPSYVDYYRIRVRLKSASEAEVRDFLKRYEGTAIADRLRNDWLLEIGRERNWVLFEEQYPQFVLDDDTQLKCYALMWQLSKGKNVADDARRLLVEPKHYGDGCRDLLSALLQAGQFSHEDIWAQARLAAESGASQLFKHATTLTGVPVALAEQVFDKPEQALKQGAGRDRMSQELFVIALGRLARSNPEQAVSILSDALSQLPPRLQALGWAQIALPASLRLMPAALDLWRKSEGAPLSQLGHEWKARTALRQEDWPMVKATIEAMPRELRDDPAWVYWRGRAYLAEGNREHAESLFRNIAAGFDFYGQLALEELGQQITIPKQASPVTREEVVSMSANEGFRRALKFFAMGLRFEGVREWNWELRKMNERQLLAAAEFARQNNVLDRMINTSDRTQQEFDFRQRFPTPFQQEMAAATKLLGLEPAWVYGLIRQESRFIMDARSHVGASGLMQLMPATARYVARKIGMNDFRPEQVNDLPVNLRLGTSYLAMVLESLDGSQPLATAAYNAGPRRPHEWRSRLTKPVEGAIFAETIPFTETRGYVKNVMSNTMYYAALTDRKGPPLKSRLGIIVPKEAGAVALP